MPTIEERMEHESKYIGEKVAKAHALVDEAIEREVTEAGRELAGIVILFSGGNDSTTLAHMFRERATHAGHANTGIGIEQTRMFVRQTCASWGLSLLEHEPRPGETYEDLVLGRCVARTGPNKGTLRWPGGFPGPGAHFMMFQLLKERAIETMRNELVVNPRRRRVVFLAGRRADESQRRSALISKDPIERRGSAVYVSPLVDWTKLDLNMYRRVHPDVPHNEVSDLLHMSGECLCGAFAHEGELAEIDDWFPGTAAYIRDLGRRALEAGMPEEKCTWGWGWNKEKASKAGLMCSSCDDRFQMQQGSED